MTTLVRGAVVRVAARLRLTVRAVIALIALVAACAVAAVGFGGLTEDVAAHNGQQRFDFRRLDWFVQHRTHLEIRAADLFAKIGAVGTMAVLAVVAAAVLWRRRDSLAVVLTPLVAFVGAAGATTVTKTLVGRGRPPVPLRLIGDAEPSFPSGHTTATTAVVLTIAILLAVVVFRHVVLRIAAIGVGIGLPAAVGVSRLVIGAHWPTDVVAGWLLGTAVASIALAAGLLLAPRLPSSPQVQRLAITRWRARRHRSDEDTAALTAPARASVATS